MDDVVHRFCVDTFSKLLRKNWQLKTNYVTQNFHFFLLYFFRFCSCFLLLYKKCNFCFGSENISRTAYFRKKPISIIKSFWKNNVTLDSWIYEETTARLSYGMMELDYYFCGGMYIPFIIIRYFLDPRELAKLKLRFTFVLWFLYFSNVIICADCAE